jgi:hypothetical protein
MLRQVADTVAELFEMLKHEVLRKTNAESTEDDE